MRYDVPVYFQKTTPGSYNASTGNYGEDTVKEIMQYAAVMDTGAEMLQLVYGQVKQGSLTIHIQNHYVAAFDRIRIGEKLYSVDLSRKLRTKQTFVVSEVQ